MEDLKKSFLVLGNNIVGFGGSGEENTIESISVNGVDIAPDENKNIDITVPSIDGLTKDIDLATVAKSGNYEDLDNKPEIPSIEGLAKTTDIPTKVSELENDSKYQTESDVTTTLTDYATKTYVGEQIANAEHLKREIVTVLPSDEEASDNIIYMLKVESATGNDKYQEYMKIDGTVQMVGDTSVDLTDYAKIAEIPTTVAELTDSADYAKTTDIPTSLPANGGNSTTVNGHTVKSNVPENAVFTDTVYDDTEVKGSIDELNSNLSDLKYGEVVGGKNLVNIIDYESKAENNYTYKRIPYKFELGKKYTISGNCERVSGVTNKLLTITLYNSLGSVSDSQASNVSFASGKFSKTFTINENNINANSILIYTGTSGATLGNDYKFSNIQLEEGSVATPYEPYIPSVKMLAEEVNAQNESLSDYGLNNVYEGEWSQNGDWIRTENYISANENDVVVVKCDAITSSGGFSVLCFDSSSETSIQTLSSWTAKEAKFILPSGTTRIKVSVGDSNLTVEKAGNIGVYINNQIEQIKNDLSKNEFYSGTREIELMGYNIYGFGFWIPIPTLKNITVNSAKVFSGSWIDLTFEEVVYNKGIFPIAKFTNVESITKGYVFGCKINVTIS